MSIHKAQPGHGDNPDRDTDDCAVCAETVKRVPGGHGPTWIHTSTGAVAGPDPAPTTGLRIEYLSDKGLAAYIQAKKDDIAVLTAALDAALDEQSRREVALAPTVAGFLDGLIAGGSTNIVDDRS